MIWIYIINKQGRLDISIRLFDKYISKKDYQNFNERLLNVVNAFYSNNRDVFIDSLYNNDFVSSRTYKKLLNQ